MKRITPLLDAWVEQLRAELKPRGARTDLARFIAAATGGEIATWKSAVPRFLRRATSPSAEVLLLIEKWRNARKRHYK